MIDNSTVEGSSQRPPRIRLSSEIEISRIVTGLWQVADMEKSGAALDIEGGSKAMLDYIRDGFDTFDMADHYGSSELIAGNCIKHFNKTLFSRDYAAPTIFTKWCPKPGDMTASVVAAGVKERLDRLETTTIDLLQFHWWNYENSGYLDALTALEQCRQDRVITNLGLTNFNSDHLRVVLESGIRITTNQVSFSLLDRRAAGRMTELCLERGIKILAYGTLCGGFLTDKWVGLPEPSVSEITDWSKMKYKRFIEAFGGWEKFQVLLKMLSRIARKHGVSVANVATRWVIEQPAVGAVIVGARLGEREHRLNNLELFSFSLDSDDYEMIESGLLGSKLISRDCGDEYRQAPFLTASGDLSHHLDTIDNAYPKEISPGRSSRSSVSSRTVWESIGGFARATKEGNQIFVSGTTATDHRGQKVCVASVEAQAVFILDKILAAVRALGGTEMDIVRTRIYITNPGDWETVTQVHGRYFAVSRPANTLVIVKYIVGDYPVEIEAEAVLVPSI